MTALFTKYRPTQWSQLIGHAKLKLSVKRMLKKGHLGGRAFLISGKSGIGKSTSAYLIAQDVCDAENIIEVNATIVTPKMVQEWARRQNQLLMGVKSGKAVIINECHKLRTDVVTLLLEILEKIPEHMVWLFTTQSHGRQQGLFDDTDSAALESRCVQYALNAEDYRIHFAKFTMGVAELEDLGGSEFEQYLELADETECNLRAMLSRIEAGDMMVDAEAVDQELNELLSIGA